MPNAASTEAGPIEKQEKGFIPKPEKAKTDRASVYIPMLSLAWPLFDGNMIDDNGIDNTLLLLIISGSVNGHNV